MKRNLLLTAFVLLMTYLYFYPGLNPMLSGASNPVMSDGSDPAALPYVYQQVIDVWKTNPLHMFYGAVYSDTWDPEKGTAIWTPWSERWVAVLGSYLVPVEQISTLLVVILALVNFFTLYFLCRYLKWNEWISIGLAICWSFNAFTRARAKVHMSMTGIYHVPLIFLGLLLIVRGKSWKSVAGAAACFLIAGTTTHYFIITSAFLSPFFLIYLLLQPNFLNEWKWRLLCSIVSVVPVVFFLGFNFLHPIPEGTRMSLQDSVPKTGDRIEGRMHPFLYYYSAEPIDYLTGDIALQAERSDINPIRGALNNHVVETMKKGNFHERTNGLRWSLIVLALIGLGYLFYRKIQYSADERKQLFFFLGFAIFTFLLSMPPDFPFERWGPSGWLYSLVNQIRVTNRSGIWVHFSLLMMVGYFLTSLATSKIKLRKWLLIPGVFPALMILDYPPLVQQMPMATVQPVFTQLTPKGTDCGTGLYFPFISPNTDIPYYAFMQRLRGTNCRALNGISDQAQSQWLTNLFPPTMELVHVLRTEPRVAQALEKVVRCVPLSWLVFDPVVDSEWRQEFCNRLGWTLNPDLSCVDPAEHRPYAQRPDRCF